MIDDLQYYYCLISVGFWRHDDVLIFYDIELHSEKLIMFLKRQRVRLQ